MNLKGQDFVNNELDGAIEALRSETIDDGAIEGSRARVWEKISQEARGEAAAGFVAPIRGCADVQALFKPYRAGTLSDAREMLVQDHLRECVGCRNAFENRRTAVLPWRDDAPARRGPKSAWSYVAVAATFVFTVGLAYTFRDSFLPAPAGPRASLAAADGPVYLVSPKGQRLLAPGAAFGEREWVRTPKGSRAVLQLRDSSQVEMKEQSEFSVSMNRRDLTVHLERGNVIVRAAKRSRGNLLVATEDATVVVTGTIFSVNRGTKGSRVSVIEGTVRVELRNGQNVLQRGQQIATSSNIRPAPIGEEIAWSRNLDEYLGLLKEFSTLSKSVQTVQWPGMRFESALLNRVPADTVVFAAIPNYGEALNEVHRLFQQRLRESEVLRKWWQESGGTKAERDIATVVEDIRLFAQYLGDEVVMAAALGDGKRDIRPIFVAEVRRQGLREFLQAELQRLDGGGKERIRIFDETSLKTAVADRTGVPLMLVSDQMIVVAPDVDGLRQMSSLRAAQGGFAQTSFGQKIGECYRDGAGLLLAADLGPISRQVMANDRKGRQADSAEVLRRIGADDVKYFIIEQEGWGRGVNQNRATLSFAGSRHGLASWVAAPAPMNSLDFITPEASLAAAFILKEPVSLLEDLLNLGEAVHKGFRAEMEKFESETGIRIRTGLASALGSDAAFAVDGPLLPVPSWKIVAEVNDPGFLNQTVERLVAEFNRDSGNRDQKKITFEQRPTGDRTVYVLKMAAEPLELHYTFLDGYLVVGPNQDVLRRAIRSRQNGHNLKSSWRFRSLLPTDSHPNFSAVIYHNLGDAGAMLAQFLSGANAIGQDQKTAIDQLSAAAKPGLVYVYGEPDQIQVASAGGFFGITLDHIIGSAGLSDLLQRHGGTTRRGRPY